MLILGGKPKKCIYCRSSMFMNARLDYEYFIQYSMSLYTRWNMIDRYTVTEIDRESVLHVVDISHVGHDR